MERERESERERERGRDGKNYKDRKESLRRRINVLELSKNCEIENQFKH